MDPTTGNDDSQSYFAASNPPGKNGLVDALNELKLLQQNLIAGRNNAGSPSRGPILQQPNVIIPTTGAAPYMYVDPKARSYDPMSAYPDEQGHDPQYLENVRNQMMLKQFQLLPPNTPNILMNTKRLPRFAGERDDLLRDTENTFYGGGHVPAPTPKPTPVPPTKFFPVSYFT